MPTLLLYFKVNLDPNTYSLLQLTRVPDKPFEIVRDPDAALEFACPTEVGISLSSSICKDVKLVVVQLVIKLPCLGISHTRR